MSKIEALESSISEIKDIQFKIVIKFVVFSYLINLVIYATRLS